MNKLFLLPFMAVFIFVSCGQGNGSSASEKEELIKKFVSVSGRHDVDVQSLDFYSDITAQDSLNFYYAANPNIDEIYVKFINDINAINNLKNKAENHLNYGGDGSKSYYQNQVDGYEKELKAKIAKLNVFVDASEGKSKDTEWEYLFFPIERLSSMNPETVVGKVYKSKIHYFEDVYRNGAHTTNGIDKTVYFIFNGDESKVVNWKDDYTKPFSNEINFGPYKRFDDGTSSSDASADAKFVSGEFTGACTVVFRTNDGKELKFINPNLKEFEAINGCGIKESSMKSTFHITYKTGQVNYYVEDVGDVTQEGLILTSIKVK